MPRKWKKHWPLPDTPDAEERRDSLIHTIGNLTLLTSKLNQKNSHAGWDKKRTFISKYGALALNRQLAEEEEWNESMISQRAAKLLKLALKLWPHPQDKAPKGK
jgi:hypothetical protein